MLLQADEPLAKFLDYCTYGHMIDNVVLIVTGTLHERDVHVRPSVATHTTVCYNAEICERHSDSPCLCAKEKALCA